MKIILVSWARPNLMKIAPLLREFRRRQKTLYKLGIKYLFLHKGQHYDFNMMEIFFRDLGLPKPDVNLGAGSGSYAEQTAKIMILFEKSLPENEARSYCCGR
jgi:UDP-N-acetylglucosamine 2-epimerase (non-hydrolysing)